MSVAFESSAAGPLGETAVLECGVCWRVYDPALGDETRDIPAGVAFADLPGDWRCPSCDAGKDKFMVKSDGARAAIAAPHRARFLDPASHMKARVRALTLAYEAAEKDIIGLPVHNGELRVETVGFRPWGDLFVGIVTTPWCMNLVAMPRDLDAPAPGALGSKRQHALPSGGYTFTLGRMDGVGFIETCSLFSPMEVFENHEAAVLAAEAAAEGLFETEEPAPPRNEQPVKVTRRFVLTRNGAPA